MLNLIPDFAISPQTLCDRLVNMKLILLLSICEILKSVTYFLLVTITCACVCVCIKM
jgi:hypothetical protein